MRSATRATTTLTIRHSPANPAALCGAQLRDIACTIIEFGERVRAAADRSVVAGPELMSALGLAPALRLMVDFQSGEIAVTMPAGRVSRTTTPATAPTIADRRSADVDRWLTECCELVAEARTRTMILHESFAAWAVKNGRDAMAVPSFGIALRKRGIRMLKSGQSLRIGVRLKEQAAA